MMRSRAKAQASVSAATATKNGHYKRNKIGPQNSLAKTEIMVLLFVISSVIIMCGSFVYQISALQSNNNDPNRLLRSEKGDEKNDSPHLYPPIPILPIFSPIPNAASLISDTLHNDKPTIAGVTALLQSFLKELHDTNARMAEERAEIPEVLSTFYSLANRHLVPFDAAYRDRSIFPIREDNSLFLSLAAFREHLLGQTLVNAFSTAKNPEMLFIGAVVQNCFGKPYPNGTIDDSGLPCKTGRQVIGKDKQGKDMTKISDAPADKNGIEEFCSMPDFKKYCDAGHIRVIYLHDTESLGPAMARYYASKLWGGETYFMQMDSHLQFAVDWDEKYRTEIKATKSYPKSVLSAYPPGFVEGDENDVHESRGARLCVCLTKMEDPNPVVRIGTGSPYRGNEPRPTQIPFIAAGFFYTRAEFLIDVPFDPFMPWCFMGEEMILSMRAWTHGWNIYAPRKNWIAHQYRPGRLGLPKFWGSVGRLFNRPLMNNRLQKPVIQRVKYLIGYEDSTEEIIKKDKNDFVLTEVQNYGMGTERTWDEYMKFANMNPEGSIMKCHNIKWCNQGELE